MRTAKVLTTTALLSALALPVAVPAAAAQAPTASPAATAEATQQAPLTADRALVRAGEQLHIRLDHGPEVVSWISSAAFAQDRAHPAGAPEGLARITTDTGGVAQATAAIAPVAPGTYTIRTRVGGAAGPSTTITVVA